MELEDCILFIKPTSNHDRNKVIQVTGTSKIAIFFFEERIGQAKTVRPHAIHGMIGLYICPPSQWDPQNMRIIGGWWLYFKTCCWLWFVQNNIHHSKKSYSTYYIPQLLVNGYKLQCQSRLRKNHDSTRETSRFGRGATSPSLVHYRSIRKQNFEYLRTARERLPSWRRKLDRAEIRTEQRLWFYELPGSPRSISDASSANESHLRGFQFRLFAALVPGSEQSWNYDTVADGRGTWGAIDEEMFDIFAQSGHPVFSAVEKMEHGTLKSKGEEFPFISQLTQKTYRCSWGLYCRVISCACFFQSPESSTVKKLFFASTGRNVHRDGEETSRNFQEVTQRLSTFFVYSLRKSQKKRVTERRRSDSFSGQFFQGSST